jgi:predicted amidohydrolase
VTQQKRTVQVRVLQVAYDDLEPMPVRIERVAALVREQQGADLVILPELWAHGGFAFSNWIETAEAINGPTASALSAAAKDIGAVLHGGSIVEKGAAGGYLGPQGRGLWNTSVVFGRDGDLLTTYRKIHRFGFGEGEPLLLEAGEQLETTAVGSTTLGLATCYDLRFPELFRHLLDAGAEVFIVPAAWPQPRVAHWSLLGRARAVENQAFMIQCNTAGTHSGVTMGGHSQVVAPDGEVLAEAGEGEEVMSVSLHLDRVAAVRDQFPVLADRRL